MIMGFQSTHPARGATFSLIHHCLCRIYFNPRSPRGVRLVLRSVICSFSDFNPRTPRGVRPVRQFSTQRKAVFQSTHPARGATLDDFARTCVLMEFQSTHPARGATHFAFCRRQWALNFNPRTPRGVRQQTLPKSREFAWLNLLICTRGRRLSIQKQTRLCSIKLSFMLFGCEPAGEGVSSWTSHATKSKVRLEGRSAYSQSARSSAHSDFPGNKSGDCPVRGP